jgi:hypothetical protein
MNTERILTNDSGEEIEVLSKNVTLEFERIAKAFAQMGNLLDLLYLELSVLVDMLTKKEVINQEEFSKALEETAKKVEAQIAEALKAEENKTGGPPINYN